MILADTSAWIEYDRATDSAVDQRLAELIAAEEALAVTEPVMMEVLAGARTQARADQLRRLLVRFSYCASIQSLTLTPRPGYTGAADKRGSPRGACWTA